VAVNSGGKPPRRQTRATKKSATTTKYRSSSFKSVESWDRKSAGKWQSGQSSTLAPGSTQAVARRRNTEKYVARTKKVIRPRIRKQNKG
jgi:hypothetical protein